MHGLVINHAFFLKGRNIMPWFKILCLAIFVLDILTKRFASKFLQMGQQVVVIENVLNLTLIHNAGVAFGALSKNSLVVILLPIISIIIGVRILKNYHMTTRTRIASGLIIGGFLGNFAERIVLGYVVDMIYFPFLPWFVCNIADIAITFGAVIFIISLLFRPNDWREKNVQ